MNKTLESQISELPTDIRKILFIYFLIKCKNNNEMDILGFVFTDIAIRAFVMTKYDERFWTLNGLEFNVTDNFMVFSHESVQKNVVIEMDEGILPFFKQVLNVIKMNGSETCTFRFRKYSLVIFSYSSCNKIMFRTDIHHTNFHDYVLNRSKITIDVDVDTINNLLSNIENELIMNVKNNLLCFQDTKKITYAVQICDDKKIKTPQFVLNIKHTFTAEKISELYTIIKNNIDVNIRSDVTSVTIEKKRLNLGFINKNQEKIEKDIYSNYWLHIVNYFSRYVNVFEFNAHAASYFGNSFFNIQAELSLFNSNPTSVPPEIMIEVYAL